jgi:DNA invertase Pin-like site-specific DNA recombinase
MKYGYARVSTISQDLTIQIEELKKEGCEVIFEEKFTGTKTDRPSQIYTVASRYIEHNDYLKHYY